MRSVHSRRRRSLAVLAWVRRSDIAGSRLVHIDRFLAVQSASEPGGPKSTPEISKIGPSTTVAWAPRSVAGGSSNRVHLPAIRRPAFCTFTSVVRRGDAPRWPHSNQCGEPCAAGSWKDCCMSPRSERTSPPALEEDAQGAPATRSSQATAPVPKPRATRGGRTKKGVSRKPPYVLLPVLVVDETLLLPHMSIPFPIEDEEAAKVVERASRGEHRHVLVLTERPIPPEAEASSPNGVADEESELRALLADAISEVAAHSGIDGEPEWIPDPEPEPQEYELCGVGVIAEIAQFRPSGSRHVVLQGLARGIVTELVQEDPYLVARVVRQDDPVDSTAEAEAAMTAVMEQVENYISMLPNVPEEVLTMVRGGEEPGWLADLIAFSPEFTSDQRQDLLEILDPIERLRRLSVLIQKRLDVLNLRQQIQTEAQAGMDK